jgi:glycosyltransferase involved in cell wall biosynthesis
MRTDLAVVIPTFNSAATIAAVLESVRFADELLVLDSGSTDDTRTLAAAAGATVIERPYVSEGDQRHAGWERVHRRWTLALDSDEVLDGEAQAAVRAVAATEPGPGEPVAYALRYRHYFLGHPIRHGGLQLDEHVRLGLTTRTKWERRLHSHMIVDGPVGRLAGVVHHHTSPTIASRWQKMVAYAEDRSARWRAAGVRPSVRAAIWQPVRFFLGRVIVREGWRDGVIGVAWWWLMATELALAHLLLAIPAAESGGDPAPPTPPSGPAASRGSS